MPAKKPHKPIHNLGAFAHPPKSDNAKKKVVHLDHPKTPEKAKVVTGKQVKPKASPKPKTLAAKPAMTKRKAKAAPKGKP